MWKLKKNFFIFYIDRVCPDKKNIGLDYKYFFHL